jgi:hypothetical protein
MPSPFACQIRCPSCRRAVLALTCCSTCGSRLPDTTTDSIPAREAQEVYESRLMQLQPLRSSYSQPRQAALNSLLAFLRTIGGPNDLSRVVPQDIIKFFISKDKTGTTKVHTGDCPLWGRPSTTPGDCDCPRRAAATGIRTLRGKLQGIFRDEGFLNPYNAITGMGNPVDSPAVLEFEKLLLREHLQAGVKAVQSPLFNVEIYHRLMDRPLEAWRCFHSGKRHYEAALAAKDSLLYSIMWYTGLRASDAANLLHQHIRTVATETLTTAWRLHVALTKTAGKPDGARDLLIPDDGTRYTPMASYAAMCASLQALGLQTDRGLVFRMIIGNRREVYTYGKALQWAQMDARFSFWLEKARLPLYLSMQSFHGSYAARRLAEGSAPESICEDMDWTMGTFRHYTHQRVVMTPTNLVGRVAEHFTGVGLEE